MKNTAAVILDQEKADFQNSTPPHHNLPNVDYIDSPINPLNFGLSGPLPIIEQSASLQHEGMLDQLSNQSQEQTITLNEASANEIDEELLEQQHQNKRSNEVFHNSRRMNFQKQYKQDNIVSMDDNVLFRNKRGSIDSEIPPEGGLGESPGGPDSSVLEICDNLEGGGYSKLRFVAPQPKRSFNQIREFVRRSETELPTQQERREAQTPSEDGDDDLIRKIDLPTLNKGISKYAQYNYSIHSEEVQPLEEGVLGDSQRQLIIPQVEEPSQEQQHQEFNEEQNIYGLDVIRKVLDGEDSIAIHPQDQDNDDCPDLILRSKSKDISFSLKKMSLRGSRETQLLKSTVLFNFHGTVKMYSRNSLKYFDADMKFRQAIIWFVEWKYFENFILLIFFLNSLALPFYDYNDRESLTERNQILDFLNIGFTIIYTLEALLKIIAYGFIMHKRSYMREIWNIVDIVVVLSGLVEMMFETSTRELRTLRTVRVLRPLKSVNSLQGIKKHVDTLVDALPNFFNVGVFLMFVYLLLAILGLHQYGEAFANRCRYNPEPEEPGVSWAFLENETRPCTKNGLGRNKCPKDTYCGNPYDKGIPIESEGVIDNPYIFYGITNFNNIANSLLLINQMISTDSWSSFMYNLMDVDHPAFAVIYSLVIIITGNFFIMNLILAVIIDTFVNLQERELKKLKEQLIPEIVVSDGEFDTQSAEIGRQNELASKTMRGLFGLSPQVKEQKKHNKH